jgi:NADH-quinone oxidoreductase subunit K
MIPISYYLVLSGMLFALGIVAFFVKKDLITMFMSIEILLNSANLAFIAFSKNYLSVHGQIIVFFIITLAAAEASLGLAIILLIFRQRRTIKSEEISLMKG